MRPRPGDGPDPSRRRPAATHSSRLERARTSSPISRATSPGSDGADYVAIDPVRLLDTRTGNGLANRFVSGTPGRVQIATRGGIPASVVAVTINVTVTGQTSRPGTWRSARRSPRRPTPRPDQLPDEGHAANGATVPLDGLGRLAAVFGAAEARTHSSSTSPATSPTRTTRRVRLGDPGSDPRHADGTGLANRFVTGSRVVPGHGRGGVPADATAVTINVTVTGQTSAGYVTVGPTVSAAPTTSTLNFPNGDTRANGLTVAVDGSGRLAAVFDGKPDARAHRHRRHRLVPRRRRRDVRADPARPLPRQPAGIGLMHMFATASADVPRRRPPGGAAEAVAVATNLTIVNQTSAGLRDGRSDGLPAARHLDPQRPARRHPGEQRRPEDQRRRAAQRDLHGQGRPELPVMESRYHSEWEMITAIRDAEVARPDIVDVFVVGKSYQGRPIWAAKVSDNVGRTRTSQRSCSMRSTTRVST